MSVWDPPLGLLPLPQLQRPSGERPELLPQPSDPRKNWYYYGCLACEEICVNKRVVASLCTPEELAVEPFKSMGNTPRLLKHSLECDMQYYKAYSEKLEQRLHRVREERDFVAKKLENSQKAFSTLRQQASSLGRKLLECAGLESTRSVGAKEGAQEMLSILKQEILYLGETLLEYTGLGPAADENGDLDNYIPFSILAT
ncbi:hypothetical protein DFH08DRAFT_978134 [Mycena albidolilacea]|uniref:Uncharacterized protein n=1 Tax=Mycena albidolilacea TaxID=1033008 RepID=A0AAD6YZ96_9AGAR|nr:hypothetical protein DFH08DRAFT_978134 [Mycena albidolilacea]